MVTSHVFLVHLQKDFDLDFHVLVYDFMQRIETNWTSQSESESIELRRIKRYSGYSVPEDTLSDKQVTDRCINRRTYARQVRIVQTFIRLLFSPRTIILQLVAWTSIFIVTHNQWMQHNLVPLGSGVGQIARMVVWVMSIIFGFSINRSFDRRERTLQDIARFKSNLTTIYYALHSTKKIDIYKEVSMLMGYLVNYIADTNPLRDNRLHSEVQKECVDGFYEIAYRLFDKVQFPGKWPKEATMNQQIQSLIECFGRICATKDYRTPLSLRTFFEMMVYLFPILLAPFFVWYALPNPRGHDQGAYFWSWLFFLLFGTLLDVKHSLDDIFGGVYEEDILIHPDEVLDIMRMPRIRSTRSLI